MEFSSYHVKVNLFFAVEGVSSSISRREPVIFVRLCEGIGAHGQYPHEEMFVYFFPVGAPRYHLDGSVVGTVLEAGSEELCTPYEVTDLSCDHAPLLMAHCGALVKRIAESARSPVIHRLICKNQFNTESPRLDAFVVLDVGEVIAVDDLPKPVAPRKPKVPAAVDGEAWDTLVTDLERLLEESGYMGHMTAASDELMQDLVHESKVQEGVHTYPLLSDQPSTMPNYFTGQAVQPKY